MSKIIPFTPGELSGWDAVKHYADYAGKFERCKLACQVMAGFALIELHQARGIRAGRPNKFPNDSGINTSPNDSERLSWEELVREKAGISDDTARNWMKMAEGAKPRLKKLDGSNRLRELLALPPSEWTERDNTLIEKTVHKLTDGKSQLEFMWEIGVAKKPQGSGAKGGARENAKAAKPTMEEQLQMAKVLATERSTHAVQLTELSNKDFYLCDEIEVQAQCSAFETAFKIRRKWLDTPKEKRAALIKETF